MGQPGRSLGEKLHKPIRLRRGDRFRIERALLSDQRKHKVGVKALYLSLGTDRLPVGVRIQIAQPVAITFLGQVQGEMQGCGVALQAAVLSQEKTRELRIAWGASFYNIEFA